MAIRQHPAGTAAVASHEAAPAAPPAPAVFRAPPPAATDSELAPDDLWQRIREELSWQDVDNQSVDRALQQYLQQPDYLPLVSERSSLYLHYIVEEVERRGMPMEIALVPLVESTMDPFAHSSGSAAGLWQIMPATGEHLGLQQNWWFDGRRAVRDSTQGALDYLEALHQRFDGDWMLALAAYNAGEGRVARARQRNLDRGLPADYWSLELPRETRRYVPRLLALAQIVAEPENFDLQIPPVPNAPGFEVADTGGQIELAVAAELAEVDLETLKELNPGQLRWATAPGRPPELLVPVGTGARLEAEVASLTPAERVRWRYYRVQAGDNLLGIARKFGTNVALLRRANNISGSLIRTGQRLMIPSSSEWSGALLATATDTEQPLNYRVQSGDSLYRIAGKYKVAVRDIVNWNSLDVDHYLQPGQVLTLYLKSP